MLEGPILSTSQASTSCVCVCVCVNVLPQRRVAPWRAVTTNHSLKLGTDAGQHADEDGGSRRDYNEFRPDSAIGNKVPISLMNGSRPRDRAEP